MENGEEAAFHTLLIRSLTFRKTGHFRNVKNDAFLFLKATFALAFIDFMFGVPYFAGRLCTKYPLSLTALFTFLFAITNFLFVLFASFVVTICWCLVWRRGCAGFRAIFNVFTLSFAQSSFILSCVYLGLAVADIFDERVLNCCSTYFLMTENLAVQRLTRVGLLVHLAINFFMVFVNLASLPRA